MLSFFPQGQCDPRETDENAKNYYPSCTKANNDISTGGIVRPTTTNKLLAEKAVDLQAFLNPIYKQHEDVKRIGVYYNNSGAGTSVSFLGNSYQ